MGKQIAVITANLNNFEKMAEPVPQSVDFAFYRFTDNNFPPRSKAMTPRLQARIVKCFGWQMIPSHEYYLWVDSSVQLGNEDSIKWFVEQLGEADVAVMRHPNRKTIQDEALYLKERLKKKCRYITQRYKGELIDEQMAEINNPRLPLYATTALIYRNTYDVQKMMKEWWYNISRYHTIDQLSLPHVLEESTLNVNVIPDSFLKTPYLTHTR